MRTTKQLQDNLDTIFSKYIRLRDTNDYGYGTCITCRETFHYDNLECGHFRKRRHLSVRWHVANVNIQCTPCNQKDDNAAYMIAMLNKHGIEIMAEIIKTSHDVRKFTNEDYEEMYQHFRGKVKELLKDKMFTIKY